MTKFVILFVIVGFMAATSSAEPLLALDGVLGSLGPALQKILGSGVGKIVSGVVILIAAILGILGPVIKGIVVV